MQIKISELITEAGISDMTDVGGGDAVENCICCRKGMTEVALDRAVFMQMTTDLYFVPLLSEPETSQGCYPVGSACAGKIRMALKNRGLKFKDWIGRIR